MKSDWFRKFSHATSNWAGSQGAFAIAIGTVLVWAVTGPAFHYSDTWQLVINTGTTIVTFLMVFLIQNTQNRDGRILQLKIDELLRSSKAARNTLINLEDLADAELDRLHAEFLALHEESEQRLASVKKKISKSIAKKSEDSSRLDD